MTKKYAKKILFLSGLALIFLSETYNVLYRNTDEKTSLSTTEQVSIPSSKAKKEILLDVPLESQFDVPTLENGCEVTSLSMLLSYYGYNTTKNQLADQLTYVPVFYPDGIHGDPNEGFVGDINGGDWAMGVYVPPIAALAQEIVGIDYYTESKTDATLNDIRKALQKGKPVWTSVTIDFQIPNDSDFTTWITSNGKVNVTPLIHACVVTGYDNTKIYVNDPYGQKNRAVELEDFDKVFTAMGGQMLTLKKN